MKRISHALAWASTMLGSVGCGEQSAVLPPSVVLGDSVCDECNMIISDERWATATIVQGARGPEPRLFDDFNCQVNYESRLPGEQSVIARWAHCHESRQWIDAENAHYVISARLRTPMGSNTAAFLARVDADTLCSANGGQTVGFHAARQRLIEVSTPPDLAEPTAAPVRKDHTHAP